ncbi:MAG TPA: hypothetical protein VFP72_04540, partial [Kineosporiaceae bacterium]|nr:hypothetical protein [Kineosporiaceae bacterium]
VRDGSHGPVEALPATLSVIAAIDLAAREVARATSRDLLALAARGAELVVSHRVVYGGPGAGEAVTGVASTM